MDHISTQVLAALLAAASMETKDHHPLAQWQKTKVQNLRARIFAMLQELPDYMTISELREELSPASDIAQGILTED